MAEQTAISEQDLSSDPLAPAPRKPKVGATIAQASTRGRRRWNQKAWWVLSFGLIVLAIAVAAVSSGGSDNSSTNPSDNSSTTASDGHGASSGNEATPKQSKPESAPAGSGSRGELPLRDGDWRLDHITVGKNGHGDFLGNASIAYMGANPNGEDNIFTVTLFKGGKEVGILQGQSNVISRQDGATVQLASADAWVSGPYIYEFRAEL